MSMFFAENALRRFARSKAATSDKEGRATSRPSSTRARVRASSPPTGPIANAAGSCASAMSSKAQPTSKAIRVPRRSKSAANVTSSATARSALACSGRPGRATDLRRCAATHCPPTWRAATRTFVASSIRPGGTAGVVLGTCRIVARISRGCGVRREDPILVLGRGGAFLVVDEHLQAATLLFGHQFHGPDESLDDLLGRALGHRLEERGPASHRPRDVPALLLELRAMSLQRGLGDALRVPVSDAREQEEGDEDPQREAEHASPFGTRRRGRIEGKGTGHAGADPFRRRKGPSSHRPWACVHVVARPRRPPTSRSRP